MRPTLRHLCWLALCAAPLACGNAAPTPSVPIATVPPAVASAEAPSFDVALVWQDDKQGTFRTVWVEKTPDGPAERAVRPDPVVATSKGLWAIRIEDQPPMMCEPCECEAGVKCPEVEIIGLSAFAVPLSGEAKVEIPFEDLRGCGGPTSSGEMGLAAIGMMGPMVFLGSGVTIQPCDAPHPMFGGSYKVYDLEERKEVDVSPPSEASASLVARAHEALVREEEGCILDAKDEATFLTATFSYDTQGKLEGLYTFTMPSMYMCGRGPTHYEAPTDVQDHALPAAMRPFQTAPAWLVPYLRGRDISGVSVLPAGLDRKAMWEQFNKPSPK